MREEGFGSNKKTLSPTEKGFFVDLAFLK